jgi:D-alanyl-D-alanine carboxypeptidase
MPNKQIIKNVNMNLDKDFYKDPISARNLNTTKVLVNKYYYLDKDYIPLNLQDISKKYALNNMKLVNVAKDAFEEMAKDASNEKLKIIAMSTYRSYDYQVNLYNKYVKTDGKEKADTYSGRPGYSEHQTGLAADVYNGKTNYTNFESTKEFDWMDKHAHEYGFILRFPKDKVDETGYVYESWHYRYVGKDIAKYIKEHNISFEEYYATMIKDS